MCKWKMPPKLIPFDNEGSVILCILNRTAASEKSFSLRAKVWWADWSSVTLNGRSRAMSFSLEAVPKVSKAPGVNSINISHFPRESWKKVQLGPPSLPLVSGRFLLDTLGNLLRNIAIDLLVKTEKAKRNGEKVLNWTNKLSCLFLRSPDPDEGAARANWRKTEKANAFCWEM